MSTRENKPRDTVLVALDGSPAAAMALPIAPVAPYTAIFMVVSSGGSDHEHRRAGGLARFEVAVRLLCVFKCVALVDVDADASGRDVAEEALEAARAALPGWRKTPIIERARILQRAARMLDGRFEEAARDLAREVGVPARESGSRARAQADQVMEDEDLAVAAGAGADADADWAAPVSGIGAAHDMVMIRASGARAGIAFFRQGSWRLRSVRFAENR